MTDILFSSWGGVVTDNRGKPEVERQPVSAPNLPPEIDKERKVKAFIGWDGIVLRDTGVNMVDLIRAYLEAVQDESCGKCTPCRVGTRIMATIVNRIADGQGKVEDLKKLKYLEVLDRLSADIALLWQYWQELLEESDLARDPRGFRLNPAQHLVERFPLRCRYRDIEIWFHDDAELVMQTKDEMKVDSLTAELDRMIIGG